MDKIQTPHMMRALWGFWTEEGARSFFDTKESFQVYWNQKISWDKHCLEELAKNPYETSFTFYVYGDDNMAMLEEMGFNCILLDHHPFPYGLTNNGLVWNSSDMWLHKLYAIQHALKTYQHVLYCDVDAQLQHEVWNDPFKFWTPFFDKAEVQTALGKKRPKTLTHESQQWVVHGRRFKKYLNPHGACMYFRGEEVIEEVINISRSHHRIIDEIAIAIYIDKWFEDVGLEWSLENFQKYFHIPVFGHHFYEPPRPTQFDTMDPPKDHLQNVAAD